MKAAVVTSFTEPLQIQDLPVPAPAPGQVLVRIEASGLCHTDIHAAGGDWPIKPTPPFIPGHEGVGIIEQVGAGVPESRVGERVAIPVARMGMRALRVLHLGPGDTVRKPGDERLLDRRRLRGVRGRLR